ncbi:hypothetical protein Poli38472_003261 [Pythium oligandrum]|uniref:Importin N-terminal domain-containing protein n=1 Tax=Pythium oligandrum TaxID=41045 RepID=A0A8K1C675_PYTOL|nr:hypothetical protein Poli38472_003261 [Pythium oligandrum]|eukprot:TMW57336.1 hypothetical protein Poli38472_003261 [Pythium oligandrum]
MEPLMDHFVASARVLFEGRPGSEEQREANQWLLSFQASDEAWHVALLVLQQSIQSLKAAWLPPVLVVTMQLLRSKVTRSWCSITREQRTAVRTTLLEWLHHSSHAEANAIPPASTRLGCVIVAGMVVKARKENEWATWKQDLHRSVTSSSSLMMLLEILGAIPHQLQGSDKDVERLANAFQADSVADVVNSAHQALTLLLKDKDERVGDCALRCLESWSIGSIASCPDFGISMAHLLDSGLLCLLFDVAMQSNSETLVLASAEILADTFTYTPTETSVIAPATSKSVVYATSRLHAAHDSINADSTPNHARGLQGIRCRSISRVVSAIALHHAVVVFSKDANDIYSSLASNASQMQTTSLSWMFLQLMLACTSFPEPDVAQPTLEFWFFLLDRSIQQGAPYRLLQDAIPMDSLLSVLGNLVNALIQQCRYPDYFVATQQLESDDSTVEAVTELRREVADTLLSLFSKWPGSAGGEGSAACVKGLVEMMHSSSDVGTVDAILYLLSFTVELFDMASSDEEETGDDEDYEDNIYTNPGSAEGTQLLIHCLVDSTRLPPHPLVIQGITRLFNALSAALVLPGDVYVQVAIALSRGLETEAAFTIATQCLVKMSKSVIQYSDLADRQELVEMLGRSCQHIRPNQTESAQGDLLETAFRLTNGISNADFSSFCNAILTSLTHRLQSATSSEAGTGIVLVGRALGGIEDMGQRHALLEQLWPLTHASINQHSATTSFREKAIQFFSSGVVSTENVDVRYVEAVIAHAVQWLPLGVSASILRCLSVATENPTARGSHVFHASLYQALPTIIGAVLQRLQFDPALPDTQLYTRLDTLFADESRTELIAPEVVELFAFLRKVARLSTKGDADASTTIYVMACRLAVLLLEVDHQVQDICDAACDFFLDVFAHSQLANAPELQGLEAAILRAVLGYMGPKRVSYRTRSLWLFLHHLLHRFPPMSRDRFRTALPVVLSSQQLLPTPLSPEQAQRVAHDLLRFDNRHQFVRFLTKMAS